MSEQQTHSETRDSESTFESDVWLFNYTVDLTGEPTVSHIGRSVESTLGFRAGDISGGGTFPFVLAEEKERFRAMLADPPDQPFKEVFQLVDAEGQVHHGRHTYRPILDASGEVEELEAVVYRRPADWELPFDSIVDAINEGIAVMRFDGQFVYVNQRMADMVGYHPSEMIGMPVFEIMTDEWVARAKELLGRRSEGISEMYDFKLQHRDGSEFWTMVSANPMRETKGFEGSLLAVRDISRRKEMERQLEKSRDELEERVEERTAQLQRVNEALKQEVHERREAEEQALEASRAKSAFLANMSHELRTPLNAVIGYTELIQEDVELAAGHDGELSVERVGEDLGKIAQAANHLLALINDILDLSKVEAGKMDFHSERFELRALLDEVIETVEPVVDRNQNSVEVRGAEIGEIRTDRTKLKQILINLVGNAAKFTEEGEIALEVTPTRLSGDEAVEIAVSDTGIGISEEELEELFEPFTQADASSTREHGGTGLGLTICRRFSEMLQGYLTAESEVGEGSTFRVAIPIGAEEAAEPVGLAEESSAPVAPQTPEVVSQVEEEAGSGETTVLVIDDDSSVHELMGRFLRSRGFALLSASDGKEGLALARAHQPDVITLDVMMPGEDGWSVLARLKSDEETADIPVVMVTMIDDKSAGFALGAADYLVKPIQGERLVDTLSAYRSGEEERALVVEDDEDTREVVTRHLTRAGWSVDEASNGREAFEQLDRVLPSVVILDLMMPETDGFEVADAMRHHREWQDIPIVVMTAMDLTAAQRSRLEESVEAVYEKGHHSVEEIVREVVAVAEADR